MATFTASEYPVYITIYLKNSLSTAVTLNTISNPYFFNGGQATILPSGGSATLINDVLGPTSGSLVYNITDTDVANISYQTVGGPGTLNPTVTVSAAVQNGTTYVVNGVSDPTVNNNDTGSWYTFYLDITTS